MTSNISGANYSIAALSLPALYGILVKSHSDISGGITNESGGTISAISYGIYSQLHGDNLRRHNQRETGGTIEGGSVGVFLLPPVIFPAESSIAALSPSRTTEIVKVSHSDISGGITNESGGTISGHSNAIALVNGSSIGTIENSGTISREVETGFISSLAAL